MQKRCFCNLRCMGKFLNEFKNYTPCTFGIGGNEHANFTIKKSRINRGFFMVGLSGLEPPTPTLSGWCSNQLSYNPICARSLQCCKLFGFSSVAIFYEKVPDIKVVEVSGFEPLTPCLQGRCSSQLSYTPTWQFGASFKTLSYNSKMQCNCQHFLKFFLKKW